MVIVALYLRGWIFTCEGRLQCSIGVAKGGQGERPFKVCFDIATGVLDQLHLSFEQGLFTRMAAAAGAKSCFFGGFWPFEKEDVLALRPARRARRITIDPSRAYRVDE